MTSCTTVVTGETGLGKTTRTLAEIAKSSDKITYCAPTFALLKQVEKPLKAKNVEVARKPQIGKKNCPARKHKEIEHALRLGLDACAPCHGCPLRQSCEYWRQMERLKSARVALYTTAMLRASKSLFSELEGRKVVIDEDPTPYLAPSRLFTRGRLNTLVTIYVRARDSSTGEARRILASWATVLRKIRKMCRKTRRIKLLHGRSLRAALPITSEARPEVHAAVRRARHGLSLAPKKKDQRAFTRTHVELSFLASLFEFARNEPDELVALVDRQNKNERTFEIVLGYRVRLPENVDLLILDATGTRRHYETLLSRPVKIAGGHVQHDSTLVQYVDHSFSKTSLTNKTTRVQAVAMVRAILSRHKGEKAGIITHKKHRAIFRRAFKRKIPVKHYGALRGLNAFEKKSVGIVIGPFRPPSTIIRWTAAVLYNATESELREIPRTQTLHYRGKPIRCFGFKGTSLRRASRYHIVRELIQAAGRFRYVHNKRTIYVLATEIIDLPGIEARYASHDLLVTQPKTENEKKKYSDVKSLARAANKILDGGDGITAKVVSDYANLSLRVTRRRWQQVLKRLGTLKRRGRSLYFRA